MLETLRRIVQEVNSAVNLGEALEIIVQRVQQALAVDVCSVYLATLDRKTLVLMATQGLNPESVGQVRLAFDEGMVGLVAKRAETINLDNAPRHPHFKYLPETGEAPYHAFLGVPIIHHRVLLGVVVVQQRAQRRFDDDHAAFLITLAAQLAGAINHAEISGGIAALQSETGHDDLYLSGVTGAAGVAIGTAFVLRPAEDLDKVPDRAPRDIEAEVRLFRAAVEQARQEMIDLKGRLGKMLPAEERVLFDAYVLLLSSSNIVDLTIERIRAGNWAPGALRDTIRDNTSVFEEMDDVYLRERASDIRGLGRRILMHFNSPQCEREQTLSVPDRAVLIGEDVTVTELAEIPPKQIAAVVSGRGSRSSHVAILARAMGVPAVMGIADLPVTTLDGREVIVDGYTGRLFLQPSQPVKQEFIRLAQEEQGFTDALAEIAGKPAITPDGEHVPVYVNSGLLADINAAFDSGSDGIGLYRTEFPFMVRERFPGEEEQYQIYRQVLESVAPRPVTLRTLDIGGDKELPYFPITEDNPFLGWRGIRITLDHPEIFLTQLRAMLRASVGLNNLQVLLPMVSSLAEIDEALGLVERAWYELLDEGINAVMPRIGLMVEVPSAVYLAESLARRVDFLSVGTNDLIQYLLAVDRNNARVAELYSAMHTAVLQALQQIVAGAHRAGKPVSICGEMASDPACLVLLLGIGVDSVSVSLSALPRIKWIINSITRDRARQLLDEALALEDPEAVRRLLNEALVEAGLGGLVRTGRQ